MHAVETYAGGACSPGADPFGGASADAGVSPSIAATSLRFGEVTDVKLGFDGTVYIADHTCEIWQYSFNQLPTNR